LNVQVKGLDNKYYTVGMDLGFLKIDGFDIFLFGCPGLLRFKIMRDVISSGADGYIFIFDATDPAKDKDAITILNPIRKYEVPIIYLANKQDIKDVRSPEIIKTQNFLPEDCKIYPTSIKTGLNIKKSIKYLVNSIYENYKEIFKILLNYENDILGLAEKLNKNREAMRDFLNSLEVKRFIEIDRINKTYKVKKGLKNIIL
jgi:signal recognition particle receptor subunit beta